MSPSRSSTRDCPTLSLVTGQVALVTGGSSGIGRASAVALGAAGAAVAVNYIGREAAADEVVAQIQGGGGRTNAVQADVSDEGQVEAMLGRVVSELGTVDILVNNAGIQQDAPFHEMSLARGTRSSTST